MIDFRAIFDRFCNRKHCTCWFDGWFGKSWAVCCIGHDYNYESGRTDMTRLQADYRLFLCVRSRAGLPMAMVMFIGVRIMGFYPWRMYRKQQ